MAGTASVTLSTPTIVGADVRFHLSLNVADVARSVEFFRRFFGVDAAAQHADYAKFELDEPPLVLSLVPGRSAGIGALNHLGFRVGSEEALVASQRRLEMAGITTLREEGVACCHSTQTKFWVHDPDGNLWEIYTLESEAAECERPRVANSELPVIALGCSVKPPSSALGPAPAIWAHRLDQPLPQKILAHDASVDQVQLHGTFNADAPPETIATFLAEVARVVKDGGEVLTHILVADAPLPRETLNLAGIASLVAIAPPAAEVMELLTAAGFSHAQITALAETSNFVIGGIALRECKVRAIKPPLTAAAQSVTIVYRGPFAQLLDISGQAFERGRPTTIDAATAERLRHSSAADQFIYFAAD